MSGFDLILEKKPPSIELQKALAYSFNIEIFNIQITNDYPENAFDDDIKVWCMINTYTEGEFLLCASVEIFNEELEKDRYLITKELCKILDTKALMSDDSPSVLTWIMVSPDGSKTTIILDSEELDNERYIIYKKIL